MRLGRDRGSATVLVLVLTGLVGACAVGGLVVGSLLAGSRRAAAAADLAALAAAGSLQQPGLAPGVGAPCARAGEVAEANAANLAGCHVQGEVVTVRVVVAVRPLRGLAVDLPGTARAGPVGVASGAG